VRGVASGRAVVERAVLDELVDRIPVGAVGSTTSLRREQEVMVMVAQGATNPEVSEQLVITDATVRKHVGSLRRKLGARTRAELVSRVFTLGLGRRTHVPPDGGYSGPGPDLR
jgi:DNA-binding NarL/FixJ family response regulator